MNPRTFHITAALGALAFLQLVLFNFTFADAAAAQADPTSGPAPSDAARVNRAASGDQADARLEVPGGTIDVRFTPGALDLPRSRILGWISGSARAVATYYGRFPVRHLRILIIPIEGRRSVLSGTTFGRHGAFCKISVGQFCRQADLDDDWITTHEMVHLAFPSVADEHHWIEEGIATYVEPIARLEVGQLAAARVWRDLVDGLPKGLPKTGDRGLDYTPTWGRTYWGGALFCLLADVDIHRRTGNRRGLKDALRAIVAAGGSIEVEWPLTRALEIGDRGTGVPVLTELYDKMKATPVDTDLPGLWRQLGVEAQGHSVVFDDHAPLAAIRRAITAPPRHPLTRPAALSRSAE